MLPCLTFKTIVFCPSCKERDSPFRTLPLANYDIDDEHHTHGNGGAKVMGRDPAPKADIDAWVAERMKSGTVITMGEFDRLGMAIGCGA